MAKAGLRSRSDLVGVRVTLTTKEAEVGTHVSDIRRLEEGLSEANSSLEGR